MINKFGLGLAALGRPSYINLSDHTDNAPLPSKTALKLRAHGVLDAAWQAGVRHFDTARSYGLGEAFLAEWLSNNPQKAAALTVSSKWGYTYVADWNPQAEVHEVKEHSLENLCRQFEESNTLLGQHLNIYLIHSATLESGVLNKQDVLSKMAALKESGLSVGLSVSGHQQTDILEQALAIETDGQRLFTVVQATYNVLERSVEQTLREAHEAGTFVMVKEALANGRLVERQTPMANNEARTQAALKSLANQFQTSVDALCLALVAHRPFVDIVLSGAANLAHLESNLEAAKMSLPEDIFHELDNLQQPAKQYWDYRSQLPWH